MWKAIKDTYASASKGHVQQIRVQQIRVQLKQSSKGDKSIDEYIQHLTTTFNQLALLGKPIDHEEEIVKIHHLLLKFMKIFSIKKRN